MPLYEYRCDECGERFEVIQKFADEPLTVHEGCGGKAVRLLSVPALQFKGTGWYVTDYGRGSKSGSSNGSKAKAESRQESKGETKSEPKSDSKSESKSESKPPSTPASK